MLLSCYRPAVPSPIFRPFAFSIVIFRYHQAIAPFPHTPSMPGLRFFPYFAACISGLMLFLVAILHVIHHIGAFTPFTRP